MSVTRSLVETLIARRDELESRRGRPNNDFDAHIRKRLIDLFMDANRRGDMPTVKWCHEQLQRETVSRRIRRAERLVPSGILDTDEDFNDSAPRMPSANPGVSLSAFERYNWNPDIRVHPYSHNFPEAEVAAEAVAVAEPMVVSRSLNRDAPAFVPPAAVVAAAAAAANPNANRRCNNCNQLGHVRSQCPNPHVPGRRGPGSGRHGMRGGKTRRHHNKNGKKSIRRGKH
jgi:hypothetical protein